MTRAPLLEILVALTVLANTECRGRRQQQKSEAEDIKQLRKEVDDLKSRVDGLSLNFRFSQNRNHTVLLDPAEKGYQRIDSEDGFFLLSTKDVAPYLDGYRLLVEVGNPTTIRYVGFKIKVRWGPTQLDFGDNDKTMKRRELAFPATQYPGSWTIVTIPISPATSEEAHNVVIEAIETNTVSLGKR